MLTKTTAYYPTGDDRKPGPFEDFDPETGLLLRRGNRNAEGLLHSVGDKPAVISYAHDGNESGRDWYKGGVQHRDAGPTSIDPDGKQKWIRDGVEYTPLPFEEARFDKDGEAIPEPKKGSKANYNTPLGDQLKSADTIEAENKARNAAFLAFKPDEKPPELKMAQALRARPPRPDGEPHRMWEPKYQLGIEAHTVKAGTKNQFHRTDGPALKMFNAKTGEQTEEWHKDGKWHADGRPAITEPDPDRPGEVRTRWYREGKPYKPTGAERDAWEETMKKQGGPYYVEPISPDIGTSNFKASAAKQEMQAEKEKEAKKGKVKQAAEAGARKAERGVDKLGQFAKYVLSTADDLTR